MLFNNTFKIKYSLMTPNPRRRLIYLLPLSGVAFSLPLSVWLLSLFTILTFAGWILSLEWRKTRLSESEKKYLLSFLLFYCVYLLWMLNTSDLKSGLAELRLKLPFLVFPLVFAYNQKPDRSELSAILNAFILGMLISTIYGFVRGAGSVFSGQNDPRSLSPFISHIRLALMTVFSIFSIVWLTGRSTGSKTIKVFYILAGAWFLVFLFILLSLTGIIIFGIVLVISVSVSVFRSGNRLSRILLPFAVFIVCLLSVLVILNEVRSFYHNGMAYPEPLESLSANGNSYTHYPERKDMENGNRVWVYLCEPELKKEWNRISSIGYDSLDLAGQEIRFTLIRYLTSAGLRKDSSGIAALNRSDMLNIEKGITNCYFTTWSPWRKKIYETIWQIDYYRNGGNPSRHSLTQRLEFLRTGWHIFLSHPFLGAGTGDIPSVYARQYEKEKSRLEPAYRLLCHNQFLSFLVSFGLTGTVLICFAIFFPFFSSSSHSNYLCSVFFLIAVLSMLGEDTLETHAGITFFAYFYSLLLFTGNLDEKNCIKEN